MRPPYVHVDVLSSTPGRPPAARDIVQAILADHARGRLPSGARVPPVRALEHQLGISKNTVQSAYDELVARGILEARSRDGVFVRAAAAAHAPSTIASPPRVALDEVHAHVFQSPSDGTIPLSSVFIDPALLPRERIAECIRSVLCAPGLPTYYHPQGPADASRADRGTAAVAWDPRRSGSRRRDHRLAASARHRSSEPRAQGDRARSASARTRSPSSR